MMPSGHGSTQTFQKYVRLGKRQYCLQRRGQRSDCALGAALWPIAVGSWVEDWPEMQWQANMDKASLSLD
jgi:hypothetical protein